MRIYVSSTFEDLRQHRAAVALALRKMGHELKAMEEDTSEAARPVEKCIDDVRKADAYVGIFAWRYGHVPKDVPEGAKPVGGKKLDTISITEAEYRAAKKPMIFLADPKAPWEPARMDAIVAKDRGERIAALRQELGERHTVSYFGSPAELANAVSAAVYRHEVRAEFKLRSVLPRPAMEKMSSGETTDFLSISSLPEIDNSVTRAGGSTVIRVDLGTAEKPNWWTTRLYLLANLLDDLTGVAILAFAASGGFSALATPGDVRRRLALLHPEIKKYERLVAKQQNQVDLTRELMRRFDAWNAAFGDAERERSAWVRPMQLRDWLGSALTTRHVKEPDQAEGEEPMELLQRIIDWPMPYVALVEGKKRFSVVDRRGFAEHIARLYVGSQVRRVRRT